MTDDVSAEDQAYAWGEILAYVLTSVEYGITDPQFQNENSDQIMVYINRIAQLLRTVNKKVRPTFLKKRVLKIARERGSSLRPDQKRLIAEIAAAFS